MAFPSLPSGRLRPALLVAMLLASGSMTACSNSQEDVSGMAGMPAPMSMRGVSYRDRDASGRRDADELPVRGVRVVLKKDETGRGTCDKEVASTTTGEDGAFAFDKLQAGSYCISVEAEGLAPTSFVGDQTAPMTINEAEGATLDIGLN